MNEENETLVNLSYHALFSNFAVAVQRNRLWRVCVGTSGGVQQPDNPQAGNIIFTFSVTK